jgi:hypothetical protein
MPSAGDLFRPAMPENYRQVNLNKVAKLTQTAFSMAPSRPIEFDIGL